MHTQGCYTSQNQRHTIVMLGFTADNTPSCDTQFASKHY